MKKFYALFVCLPLLVLVTACGKSDDQPAVATTAAVGGANSCQAGYVYNPQYGCLPAQYGNPGYGGQPVQVTIPTQHYCAGNTGGWGYNGCWANGYSYNWVYFNGTMRYW